MTPQRLSQASLALSLATALLAGYIALRPEPFDASSDLSYIQSQLDSLSADVSNLQSTVDALPTSTSEPVDLTSIEASLDDLARRVSDRGFYSIDDIAGRIDDVCNALSEIPPYAGC